MRTSKTKILCDGRFLGLIIISRNSTINNGYIIAQIFPFESKDLWSLDDISTAANRQITELYLAGLSNEDIQEDLLRQTNIRAENCIKFELLPF